MHIGQPRFFEGLTVVASTFALLNTFEASTFCHQSFEEEGLVDEPKT